MTVNYRTIRQLANDTCKKITGSPADWKRFLNTAGRLYKYPFQDQILIYAQRPDATACATLEIWNQKMNCWVNRGAKGIALINTGTGRSGLKYVFDISDVHKAQRIGKFPYLWQYRQEYGDLMSEYLKKQYGGLKNTTSFEDCVRYIAKRTSDETCHDVAEQIISYLPDQFRISNQQNIEMYVKETIEESIVYTVLARCGMEADALRFRHISRFQSVASLSILGSSINESTKDILLNIGRGIKECEKNIKKGLEKGSETHYNTLKHKSYVNQSDNELLNEDLKRREDYEAGVSEERRLSDTKSDHGGTITEGTEKVRNTKEELPEGIQKGNLHSTAVRGQADGASSHDSESGRGISGEYDNEDGTVRGNKRNIERTESDAVGGEDEQYKEQSRGDGVVSGDYIQLSLFDSLEEQIGNIAVSQAKVQTEKRAGFHISDEMIYEILRSGGGKTDSRKRIYAKYRRGKTPEEMAEFLKKEYGTLGKGYEVDGSLISVWFDEKGMQIGQGTSAFEHTLKILSWTEIESYVRNMIVAGSYMGTREIGEVEITECMRIAERIVFLFRDSRNSIALESGVENKGFLDVQKKVASMLATHEGINLIQEKIDELLKKYNEGKAELSSYLLSLEKEVREELQNLKRPITEYEAGDDAVIRVCDFITQDEIDAAIRYGSGVSHGKYRIYENFSQEQSKKDRIEFLKNEYGIGGRSAGLIGTYNSLEEHDAKGIRLSKGDISKPYASILLSWNIVEKRISELMMLGSYLSEDEKAEYEEYKEFKISQKMGEEKRKILSQEFAQEIADDGVTENAQDNISIEKTNEDDREIVDIVWEGTQNSRSIDKETKLQHHNSSAGNYHIPVGKFKDTGYAPKEKFRKNVEAVTTLKNIENEGRMATKEEQDILSQYVGWGGLASAFDETKPDWSAEYKILKELLTEEEYKYAKESTLSAFYTSPVIIRFMYEALEKMGFHTGNILEPAMAVGNFFGVLPDTMKESRLYGVELDKITGRIAKQLYPDADIKVTGFEKTHYPNAFFDIAIGNVPFGQYKVSDSDFNRYNFHIHDYFFAKALDKVRAGGIIAFITSMGTMDKKNKTVRKYIAQRAELIGAVRLPNSAFKGTSGATVTSDILFLKKRDRIADIEPEWLELAPNEDGILINQYFLTHPEMILGKMKMVPGAYKMMSVCVPKE